MRVVSIIIARGGSKGVPKKNIMNFCGKPLIAWTILQSIASKKVLEVWVSSDSEEILEISRQYGAKTILRPDDISGDGASSESAWMHAIEYIEKIKGPGIDFILAPQVTSPLRSSKDFTNGINEFVNGKFDSLFSSTEIEDFFIWKYKDNILNPTNYDYKNRKPRQKINKTYLENGSFFIFDVEKFKINNNRFFGKIGHYTMDKHKMFQIDNLEDVKLCETVMRGYKLNVI
ncbi:MAG TPA: acylneuraminate cytidylyltransferase family protein [Flavobacteriales bacterium]|jgi:N-acylneuraminate cytidylyltransferase|nr:acylneuraminate cytidylyltransferase family protein [Flavobacteriales bacterium]